MYILGITGGIATGKSTVTRMLADLGAPTASADALARDLLAPGTASTQAVLAAFPECVDATGQGINRRALAQVIFADPDARRRLETLTHPAIIAALREQIALWRPDKSVRAAAAEIPLLFEAGLETLVDSSIVVTCSEPTQQMRLIGRDRIDAAEAGRQIAAQWPLEDKIVRADRVITTDFGLSDTARQVAALWKSL